MRQTILSAALIMASLTTACVANSQPEADQSTNKNIAEVLFWSTEVRDEAFRNYDRPPFAETVAIIGRSSNVRALEIGEPLNLDLSGFMERARVAGVLVIHKGKIRAESYGLGNSAEDRWPSFSVAKSITSTLVGAALKDGAISSLDDPVSKYVKGLQGSAYDDVTVEQLLTMTSGVKWIEDYTDPESDVAKFGGQVPAPGEAAIVTYLKGLPRAHPPGEVWNYSTGETNLIGILVSEATGVQLAQYAHEKIWEPFGMEADATWRVSPDGFEISGCCVQARVRDFGRFGLTVLENDIDLVPDDWFEIATSSQVGTPIPGYGYGFQWWTMGPDISAASGIFGQFIGIDRRNELVVVINSSWETATGAALPDGRGNEVAMRDAFLGQIIQAVAQE